MYKWYKVDECLPPKDNTTYIVATASIVDFAYYCDGIFYVDSDSIKEFHYVQYWMERPPHPSSSFPWEKLQYFISKTIPNPKRRFFYLPHRFRNVRK